MEPATLALLLMETRSRRALTDLIPGNPPADQVLGGSSYGPDPRESSYGPGPGGSSYGLDSRESFYRLGSRGSSYGLDPRESSYSPDPGESSYGPDPRESSYRPDPGESSYGPGPGGSSYRPDTRWCTRRAAWSASQPPTCRASWPSERCPSCWSWCSSCGRRSRASCPRQVLLVDGNGVLHHRDPTPADSRRLVPSAGRLWDCPGNGPEESRPQHQAPLRLRGPQDEPGGSCAPDLLLLQVPDPRARAPGARRRRGQWHAPEETPESPQVRASHHRTTAQAPGQPQGQAPRSRRARTGSRGWNWAL
nr:endonuclease V isoform X8 [Pongo abelii]